MQNCLLRRASLLLAALLGLAGAARAQAPVSGTVQDAAGRALPFATAVLLHLPDSAVAASQTTTEQGRFTFEKTAAGRYCLKGLALGYAPSRVALVVGSQPVQVPALHLTATATALKEVVVEGRPPVLEQHADRTVVNVDRLNTAGDNALEVLKKAPGVTLDKDDHVQYRGSGSVLVLIDGKQTYLSGDALTNYLKSLPASAISQLELLPTPPASMDAAGTAGVINIRTRRSTRPGLTGTTNAGAGYGRYEKGWGGANLAYNVGKVRAFGRLDAGHYNSFNNLIITRQIRDTSFALVNYWHPVYNTVSYAAGADVALTKRQTLGGQMRGDYGHTDAQVSSNSEATAPNGQPAGSLAMRNPKTSTNRNLAFNLNYRLALDTLGRELTADADLVQTADASHQDFLPLSSPPAGAAGALVGQQRSNQGANVTIGALKTDYVHPFAHSPWRAEAGAKASWVTTSSYINFELPGGSGEWQNDATRSNQFRYQEAITAGYFTLSTSYKALELKAGLRGEHTHSVGESATTGQRVERDYFQLFPTAFASYKLGAHDQLSASVGRRISRPSYQSLNPFLSYSDAYTAHQGNPFLQPSLARSFVFNYVHRDFQVLSLSYLLETDVVNEVAYQDDQTKVTTSRLLNLDRALNLTLTSGGHTDLSKVWGMDNQLAGSYSAVQTLVQGQDIQLRRFAWTASSDHTFRLPHQVQLLVGGSYSSPDVMGLFLTKASGYLNLGVKKQLADGRATLALKLADVFNTNRFRATQDYNNVHLYWSNQWESRRLTLTFSYKLGSGTTHARHSGGSADEEGRAGH